MLKKAFFALLIGLATTVVLSGEEASKRPTPPSSAQCELPGGKTIVVKYSSPHMTGQATTFVTDETLVTVAGRDIPAGSYTIFSSPKPEKWTLVIRGQTSDRTTKSTEIARVPMSTTRLSSPVENGRISFDHTPTGCTMHMTWDKTDASVAFNVKNTDLPVLR
ncbi:MAG TPA: DUF2911 domain-containing protein [Terriglobales bacterium]|nr:DUF2911 domain-containing protein [Terriglobales bacterium]